MLPCVQDPLKPLTVQEEPHKQPPLVIRLPPVESICTTCAHSIL